MSIKEPLVIRLYQYQWERFPVVVVLLTSIVVLGSSLAIVDARVSLWQLIVGFVTLVLFPFHMRLFDELKDSEHDKKHYPNRPIPRGLISLQEVKRVLLFVIAGEILINLWWGLTAFFALLVALIYSGLAAKEFFIRSWLRKHFFAYLGLHQLQLAFVIPYLYLLFGAELNLNNNILIAHFLMVFTLLFLLEWARKMRREEDENVSRDTYSARLGRIGSTFVYDLLATISTGLFVFISRTVFLGGEVWGWLALGIVLVVGLGYAQNFYKRSDAGVQLAALSLFLMLNSLLGLSLFI